MTQTGWLTRDGLRLAVQAVQFDQAAKARLHFAVGTQGQRTLRGLGLGRQHRRP